MVIVYKDIKRTAQRNIKVQLDRLIIGRKFFGSGTNVRLNVGDNLKLSPTLEFIRALHL